MRAALATVGAPGVRLRVEVRPQGHAATLAALGEAQRLLREDRTKIAVVGGADSYHDPETLAWLRENRQWLGEDSRSAFAPGEGAAFVALTRANEAKGFRRVAPTTRCALYDRGDAALLLYQHPIEPTYEFWLHCDDEPELGRLKAAFETLTGMRGR